MVVDEIGNIDWNRYKPPRAGVVVYTFVDGHFRFGLGVDTRYGTLTDFGGGVKYSEDLTAVEGGLRELKEESLGVFGEIEASEIAKCVAVCADDLVVMFINLKIDPREVESTFKERHGKCTKSEVRDILWFSREEYIALVEGQGKRQLYDKVRQPLLDAMSVTNYIALL